MGGLVLDIWVACFCRSVTAFVRRILSRKWPTTRGTVFQAYQAEKTFGCNVVIVSYDYAVAGEKYSATHDEPFLFDSTGSFVRSYPRGQEIAVRYKAEDSAISVAL